MSVRPNFWAPVLAVGVVAVGIVAIPPLFWDRMDRGATAVFAQELTDSAAAAVPPGAGVHDAYMWFKSRNMPFTSIDPGAYPGADVHGIPPEDYGGAVFGTAHQKLHSGYNTHHVYFFLGKDRRVIKHLVVTSFMDGG